MPALETCQYELKEANRKIMWLQKAIEHRDLSITERDTEILKLNKAITQRDVLVSDVLRENFELKQKLDEIQTNMRSRSHLQALLSAITDEEVDADV